MQVASRCREGWAKRKAAGPKGMSGLLTSNMMVFREAKRGLEASGRGAHEMLPPAGELASVRDRLAR